MFLLIPLCLIAVLAVALTITSKWESKNDSQQQATQQGDDGDKVSVVSLLKDVGAGQIIPVKSVTQREVDRYKAPANSVTALELVYGRKSAATLPAGSILTVDDLGAVAPSEGESFARTDAGDQNRTSNIAGRYSGTCSGQPIVTEFSLDKKHAQWAGIYLTQADLHSYSGSLAVDAVTLASKSELSAKWRDKFGVGRAHFVFQRNGKSFKGTWTNDEGQEQGEWSGVKTEDTPIDVKDR